jgi:hypothetical protein
MTRLGRRQKHDPAVRDAAVAAWRARGDKSLAAVAVELGLPIGTLSYWSHVARRPDYKQPKLRQKAERAQKRQRRIRHARATFDAIVEALNGPETTSAIAARFGVTRETVSKYAKRARAEGTMLRDRRRRSDRIPIPAPGGDIELRPAQQPIIMKGGRVRASSVSLRVLTRRELDAARVAYPERDHGRPATRAECANVERPCPYVSCRHHLYLDVNSRNGSIKFNHPDREPHELVESCALDVAERGPATLLEVGTFMNVTRERARQIELDAVRRVRAAREFQQTREDFDL